MRHLNTNPLIRKLFLMLLALLGLFLMVFSIDTLRTSAAPNGNTASTPLAECTSPWDAGIAYSQGNTVSYEGFNWTASAWMAAGTVPSTAPPVNSWDPFWVQGEACTPPEAELCFAAWSESKATTLNYAPGSSVSHNMVNYISERWVAAEPSAAAGSGWIVQNSGFECKLPEPPPPGSNPGAHIYYFPEWGVYGRNYQVAHVAPLVEAGYVDTIQYAFIDVEENGSCAIDDENVALDWAGGIPPYDQKGTLAQMKALRDDHVGELKIILSLGGWTLSDYFSPIAADPAKRATLVSSCIAMMQQYDFDGLDIDWEFPGGGGRFDNVNAPDHENVDGPNLALLLQELRAGLTAAGTDSAGDPYLLTIAVNAGQDKIERLPLADIHPSLDYIQLMTYDLNGGWSNMPAHNAPLYANPNDPRVINDEDYVKNYNSAYAVQAFVDGGVPTSKLVLGLAFYGRSWVNADASQGFDPVNQPGLFGFADNGSLSEESGFWCQCEPDYTLVTEPMWNDDGGGLLSDNANDTPGASADGLGGGSWDEAVYDYDDVQNVLLNNGWTRYWDEYSMSPYAYNPDIYGGSFVSYDDVQSIAIKTKFAADHCLGGIMVWEFTGNNENVDLYGAIQDGMAQSAFELGSTAADCPTTIDQSDSDAPNATPMPTAVPEPTAVPDPDAGDGGVHIYYFPEWGVYGRNYQVGDIKPLIDAGYVNTIQYSFIDVLEDGTCQIDDEFAALEWTTGTNGYTQTGTLAQMAALRDDYLGDVKIVLSLGGWTLSDHFSMIAADSAKLQTMAQSCVSLMEQYRFDGLDIDWEFPGGGGRFDNINAPNHETVDGPNFAIMLETLRGALDAAGTGPDGEPYLLTAAVNAGEDKINRLPLEDIHPHLDYLSLMTYDLNGAWQDMPAHNAPLYANDNDPRVVSNEEFSQNYNVDFAIDEFLRRGVPPSKLVMGLAFYGRAWVNVDGNTGYDPTNMPGLFGMGSNGTLDEESGYWCECEPDYSLMPEPMWNDDGGGLLSDNANQTPGASADGLGSGSWDEAVFDYDDVQNVLLNNGWTRYWDAEAMVPFAYNPDYAGGSWVSYDDVESIAIKTQYASDRCLGGIMVWEFTGNSENTDLYDAIQDGMGMSEVGFNSTSADCDNVMTQIVPLSVGMATETVNGSVSLLALVTVMITMATMSAAVIRNR